MRQIRMEIDNVRRNQNMKNKKNKVTYNEKKRMSIRELPYIPDHIILFILHRLPVKSLIRFKTVSKTWNALTTDPDFIREHHALQPSSKLLLVQRKEKDAHIYPMPLTFDKSTKSLCAHRNVYQPYESDGSHVFIGVLGHCFGVFFIEMINNKKNPDTSYTLCNIATGVTKKVPYLRPGNNDEYWTEHGFGCVSGNTTSVPEFKIVRLAYFIKGGRVKCLTHVYTSATNSWKLVESCQSMTVGPGVELNGIIHWLAESLTTPLNGIIHWLAEGFTTPRDTNEFILTFDLKKEVFGRIEIPHGTRGPSLVKRDDQCLSLIVPSSCCTDIWVMRYGESWVRQAKVGRSRVDSKGMLGYLHQFKPLLLEDHGEKDMEIVTAIGNKEGYKNCFQFPEAKLFTYVESLVSFNF